MNPHKQAKLTRGEFLRRLSAMALGLQLVSRARASGVEPATTEVPITGVDAPELRAFDELMTAFVRDHKMPGAALAVSRRGKLVYARGFGYADREKQQAVQPASRFRIASVSKPFTAVATMQLVEQGKIKLDDPVLDYVKLRPHLEPGGKVDPRWHHVSVRHCLQHTGGWDRAKSFDPIGIPWKIAAAMKIEPPITPTHIIRYMLGQPLDSAPGERYAYANLDYLLLGRAIETASGQPYETYVREKLLAPLGIADMQLGRARIERRAPDEVRYYDAQQRRGRATVGPTLGEDVPTQYGADNLEAYEAHGGWIASAASLVRFAAAFDDPEKCPLLRAETIRTMWARPAGLPGHEADGSPRAVYYACGWQVRPLGNDGQANVWHGGLIGGTSTLLVRRHDGLNWAVLFNTDRDVAGKTPSTVIDPLVHKAADRVRMWPDRDLFGDHR